MSNESMSKQYLRNCIYAGLLMFPLLAFAKPEIVINIISEKEVVVEEKGKQITKKVLAKDIEPGEELIFTITYKNKGDEIAKNVAIKNPVPEGAVYVVDSAKGKNSDITFSIDNGKTFKKPSLLTYEHSNASGKRVRSKASYEQYSHVQWLVKEVLPNSEGSLTFKVKVK